MKLWTDVRHYVLADGHSKREACHKFNLHWDTLKKMLAHPHPPGYTRSKPKPAKKIDRVLPILHRWLEQDRQAPAKQRHTAKRIHERLVKEHRFDGGLMIVKDAVRAWRKVNAQTFVPLMRGEKIIERPADQTTITKRYTEEAIQFIRDSSDGPFFLYLAHSMPHIPLFVSKAYSGTSPRGLYGDVIKEIDWSVGQIIQALHEEGLAENTLVVFTSDNGPWQMYDEQGGSAGPLYGGKATCWEGGMRVPGVFWWPGKIKSGVVRDLGSALDLYTTACKLAGASIPKDRIIDGLDLRPVLFSQGTSPRNTLIYYKRRKIHAMRVCAYKLHLRTTDVNNIYGGFTELKQPLLYNLEHDPGEKFNIADQHPEQVEAIMEKIRAHRDTRVMGEDQLIGRVEQNPIGVSFKYWRGG